MARRKEFKERAEIEWKQRKKWKRKNEEMGNLSIMNIWKVRYGKKRHKGKRISGM